MTAAAPPPDGWRPPGPPPRRWPLPPPPSPWLERIAVLDAVVVAVLTVVAAAWLPHDAQALHSAWRIRVLNGLIPGCLVLFVVGLWLDRDRRFRRHEWGYGGVLRRRGRALRAQVTGRAPVRPEDYPDVQATAAAMCAPGQVVFQVVATLTMSTGLLWSSGGEFRFILTLFGLLTAAHLNAARGIRIGRRWLEAQRTA